MIIQENNLEEKCLELISRTLVDLGQVKPADEKVVLAKRLSQILITRYSKLSWQAVEQAFDDGVLDSDEFHLCGKTMSKWLYRIKKMIWEGWYNDQHGAKHLIDNKTKALLNNQKLIG
tara:strand:+ start:311 stop:664 length:354 start_codon:yes stop_codon:yes gene_type:complete